MCLRLLAYSTAADSMDKNLELSKETVAACDLVKERVCIFDGCKIWTTVSQSLSPTAEEKCRMPLIMKNWSALKVGQ